MIYPPIVVLNGGKGTRLGALTQDRPKCLVPVGDQPFLVRQWLWIYGQGITDVRYLLNHQADQITPLLAAGSWMPDTGMGIVDSIQFLMRDLITPFFFIYGDVMPRISAAELCAAWMMRPNTPALLSASVPNGWEVCNCNRNQYLGRAGGTLRESGFGLIDPVYFADAEPEWTLQDFFREMGRSIRTVECPPPAEIGSLDGLRAYTEEVGQ